MKIVAVMGTYRKNGSGAEYIRQIEQTLNSLPDVTFEYIWLGDCNLSLCRGCMVCYERGEDACPLKDGYFEAIRRLNQADAAIFYSPTYTLSISGLMKTFFDRSSFVLHRPYFKGRHALALTVSDAWGERLALKTLRRIVSMIGFSVDGTLAIVNSKYKNQLRYRERIEHDLVRMAKRLSYEAQSGKLVRPSLFELVAFRFHKSVFGKDTDGCKNDKHYWRQVGWAAPEATFYCSARISPVKAFLAKVLARALQKRQVR